MAGDTWPADNLWPSTDQWPGGEDVPVPTANGLVRLIITDLSTPQIFTDAQISMFLTLEGDVVKLAAAAALDTIASNEALVSKRIETLDLKTDGPAVAKELRAHAASLRAQVKTARADEIADDEAGAFAFTSGFGNSHPELTGWSC